MAVTSMHEMAGDRWVLTIAPGYWAGKISRPATASTVQQTFPHPVASLSGYTMGLALKREFTAHWGAGIVGAISQQNGQSSALSDVANMAPDAAVTGTPGGAGFAGGNFKGLTGDFFALMLTFDPYSKPEGFRMPISIGPAYIVQSVQYTHTYVNPNNGKTQTEKATVNRNKSALFVNPSLDFLMFRNLRVMPGALFILAGAGNKVPFDYKVAQAGSAEKTYPTTAKVASASASIYVSFLYRPWNLSFNYALPVADLAVISQYSFTWTKKWG